MEFESLIVDPVYNPLLISEFNITEGSCVSSEIWRTIPQFGGIVIEPLDESSTNGISVYLLLSWSESIISEYDRLHLYWRKKSFPRIPFVGIEKFDGTMWKRWGKFMSLMIMEESKVPIDGTVPWVTPFIKIRLFVSMVAEFEISEYFMREISACESTRNVEISELLFVSGTEIKSWFDSTILKICNVSSVDELFIVDMLEMRSPGVSEGSPRFPRACNGRCASFRLGCCY